MKKLLRILFFVLLAVVLIGSFVHPFGNPRAVASDRPLLQGAQVPPAVMSSLQRSCRDCHSEQTTWPWYSHVAPVSWLVESDVSGGRDHMNLSHWDELSPDDRQDRLSKIGSMVRNKKMPQSQYTLIHRDAKLSDADIDAIYQWARAERKRLRDAETPAATASSPK